MISLEEYLMGREKEYPPSLEMLQSANDLLEKVDDFFYSIGIELDEKDLSSGYRPGKYNVKAGGSNKSCHLLCLAIDIKDGTGKILKKLLEDGEPALVKLLAKHGLYMEHYSKTRTWIHLQTRPTKNRIFMP